MRAPDLIQIDNLSVRFGGVKALTDISFSVPADLTFGIIGPNGAGKTTLFNCISGFIRPVPGSRIRFDGKDLVGQRVDEIARLGIARTFQNISLVRKLTVRENILTGLHLAIPYSPFAGLWPSRRVREAEHKADLAVERVADLLGFSRTLLDSPTDTLSLGLQKKVEVARAIVRKPRVLMLDEPAGGLNDAETRDLAASLRRLKQDAGLTLIVIDHDMSLVMPLCDRLCVLNFGEMVAVGSPVEIGGNQSVIDCYLGVDDAA